MAPERVDLSQLSRDASRPQLAHDPVSASPISAFGMHTGKRVGSLSRALRSRLLRRHLFWRTIGRERAGLVSGNRGGVSEAGDVQHLCRSCIAGKHTNPLQSPPSLTEKSSRSAHWASRMKTLRRIGCRRETANLAATRTSGAIPVRRPQKSTEFGQQFGSA